MCAVGSVPLVVCCFSFVGFQHSSSGPPSPSACARLSPLLSPRSLLTPFQPLVLPSFLVLLRVLLPILVPPSSSPCRPLPLLSVGFCREIPRRLYHHVPLPQARQQRVHAGGEHQRGHEGRVRIRKYYIKGLYVVILLVVYHAHWMSLDWVIDWVYRLRMFETPRTET